MIKIIQIMPYNGVAYFYDKDNVGSHLESLKTELKEEFDNNIDELAESRYHQVLTTRKVACLALIEEKHGSTIKPICIDSEGELVFAEDIEGYLGVADDTNKVSLAKSLLKEIL